MKNKTKLLFIAHKIHENDDDFVFAILWVKEFIRQGIDVQVICLEKGDFDDSFPVYSLGRERGESYLKCLYNFFKFIFKLDYDRVFVHQNPKYITYGFLFWWLKKIPTYLWYTHYTMHIHLWLSGVFCKRMFAATVQSLPQYNDSEKKVVTGHGIDIDHWLKDIDDGYQNHNSEYALLAVHRICRSKRVELTIKALLYLPEEYNLTIYGRPHEKDYYKELKEMVKGKGLNSRVKFIGPVPMDKLKQVYPEHRLMINMASETIDKTMVESMLFGIYPITTKSNSEAIGLPVYPENETSESIAKFILDRRWEKYDTKYLQGITKEKHSMRAIIKKMGSYIIKGN